MYFFANGIKTDFAVIKIATFDNRDELSIKMGIGANTNDSLSLLYLDREVSGITPLSIKAVSSTDLINEVTFTGFGMGGLISPKFPDIDLEFNSVVFRNKEGIKCGQNEKGFKVDQNTNKSMLPMHVSQKTAQIGHGDSGGPVLTTDGKVIGINQSFVINKLNAISSHDHFLRTKENLKNKFLEKAKSGAENCDQKHYEVTEISNKIDKMRNKLKTIEKQDLKQDKEKTSKKFHFNFFKLFEKIIKKQPSNNSRVCSSDPVNNIQKSNEELNNLIEQQEKILTEAAKNIQNLNHYLSLLKDNYAIEILAHKKNIKKMLELIEKFEKPFNSIVFLFNQKSLDWMEKTIKEWSETPHSKDEIN